MGNEVEIVVTSDNRSRPGVQAAKRDMDDLGKSGVKAGDAVSTSMSRMADKVTAAQARVTRAHQDETRALQAVISASNDVDFLRIGGDADKLTAAQRRLDVALRQVAHSQREVTDASTGLRQAQADLDKAGETAGKDLVRGMARGSSGAAPALKAAIVPAAMLAGGAGAGALVGAFGLGLGGLGLIAGTQFGHVKNEWAELGEHIKTQSKSMAVPFGQALIDIENQAEHTFDSFVPTLREVSKEIAPAISDFTGQLFRGLERLKPALEPIASGFSAVIRAIGARMPDTVSRLSRGFQELAESVEENPEALADLVSAAGVAAETLLQLLAVINDLYAQVSTPVKDAWSWLEDASDKVGDWLTIREKAPEVAAAEAEAEQGAKEALDQTAQSAEDAAAAHEEAAKAAEEHARAMHDLQEATDDLIGSNLGLREATMAARDDIADYTEAVREHGKGSREAAEAQLDAEQSAWRMATAARESALAQQTAAGASHDLGAANLSARAQLQALADTAQGPLKAALQAQIAELDRLIGRLHAVNGTFYANVQVRVSQTGRYAGPLLGANLAFAAGGIAGGALPSAATGGARGGPVLVNEQRQEAAHLPSGDVVALPHGSTVIPTMHQAALQAGGRGGPAVVVVRLEVDGADQDLLRLLRKMVRVHGGGNVQNALGKRTGAT